MEKNIQPLIAFIGIIVLIIPIGEIIAGGVNITRSTGRPVPTTVTDKVGDTPYPGQPCTDIVEVTVEKNETNLTTLIVTIKVNGDIPNQTDPSKRSSWAEEKIAYSLSDRVCLELEDNGWILKLGHIGYRGDWVVERVGDDVPASFTIDHEGRTIQIILDCERAGMTTHFPLVCAGYFSGRSLCGSECDTLGYAMFILQSNESIRQSVNIFYLGVLTPVLIGGVAWWWISARKNHNRTKGVNKSS